MIETTATLAKVLAGALSLWNCHFERTSVLRGAVHATASQVQPHAHDLQATTACFYRHGRQYVTTAFWIPRFYMARNFSIRAWEWAQWLSLETTVASRGSTQAIGLYTNSVLLLFCHDEKKWPALVSPHIIMNRNSWDFHHKLWNC